MNTALEGEGEKGPTGAPQMTRMLGQYLERRERGRRENAWRELDSQEGGVPDIAPVQDIHRRALDRYSRNGGDLSSLHEEAALAMSRRLLAMGHGLPHAAVHHRLYPAHRSRMESEWQRGGQWLALTSDAHRRALSIMRDHPGTPGFEAARRFDEAFADWLQNGTEADVAGRHTQALAQIGLAGGVTFEL